MSPAALAPPPINRKAVLLAVFIAFGTSEFRVRIDSHPYLLFQGGFLFGYDIGVISVRPTFFPAVSQTYPPNSQGCLIMPDFIRRFGQPDGQGGFFLSSSRQSIITSLLSAGYVHTTFKGVEF